MALRLLEKDGFDRLSLRGVAQSLKMHAAGLYWYIENKQELIDLMAKAIMDEAFGDLAPPAADQRWEDWLTEIALKMRRVLLKHRDGARVVAGAILFRTKCIADYLELALEMLESNGFSRETAMLGAITVMRYTLGIALDDQESPIREIADRRRMIEQVMVNGSPVDAERWPRLADIMGRWYASKHESTDHGELHFRHGLRLVIAGIRSTKGIQFGEL